MYSNTSCHGQLDPPPSGGGGRTLITAMLCPVGVQVRCARRMLGPTKLPKHSWWGQWEGGKLWGRGMWNICSRRETEQAALEHVTIMELVFFFKFFYWSIVVCNVVLIAATQSYSVIHTDTFSFHILFHYGLSQEIRYSSLYSFLVWYISTTITYVSVWHCLFILRKSPLTAMSSKTRSLYLVKQWKCWMFNSQVSEQWVKLHKMSSFATSQSHEGESNNNNRVKTPKHKPAEEAL